MKRTATIFLVITIIFIIFYHFYYFSELYYDRDLAGYAYNTLDILRGRGWYYSTWHPKPPGINFIFLAAFSLFGQSFKSIYSVALIFNIISAVLIYFLAKKLLIKETKLYFLLPVLFVLLFAPEPLKAYSANTEVFLATFEIAAILFLGLNKYFISGIFLGLGLLIRQSGIFTFFAGVFFIITANVLDKKSFKSLFKSLISFTAAFILPLLLTSLYFLSAGVFSKFFNSTFFNDNLHSLKVYLSDVKKKDLFFTKGAFLSKLHFEIILFGLFSLIGFMRTILLRRTKVRLLVSFWFAAIFTGLSISAIYPHHFIQGIAPLACISLLGLSDILEGIKVLFKRRIYLRNIFIAVLTVALFIPCIRLLTPLITQKIPVYYTAGAADRFYVAQYIKEHTAPYDKIFVWDNLSTGAIFLWSGRDSIVPFYEKYAFLPPELREYWVSYANDYQLNQQRLLLELNRQMPKYIIIVLDYAKIIRWKALEMGKNVISSENYAIMKREAFESEKKAFPDLFDLLNEKYTLEMKIGMTRIYRIKN